jgi:hypothetical protein
VRIAEDSSLFIAEGSRSWCFTSVKKNPPLSCSIVPETFRATLLDLIFYGKIDPEAFGDC